MNVIGKYIFFTGAILVVVGFILWIFGDKLGFLGNLPGDIQVKKEHFSFYFPVTTMILISLAISIVVWIARKIFE